MMTDNPHDRSPTRRSFLDWVLVLGSVVVGAAMALPGFAYLWPAARGGGASSIEVEGADALAPGQGKIVQLGSLPVVVVRDRSGFRAFSAVCTHLGCLVKWDAEKREFLCPCHAAVFDAQGRVVSGPPPAPLPELPVKEVEGKVFVSSA